MKKIRIVVVDDHQIVRQGVRSLLSNYDDFEIVGEAETATEAMDVIGKTLPDVVLLDIRMPGESGIQTLRKIRNSYPQIKVLMLTSYREDEYVIGALREKADGYVLKSVSDETLVHAILAVHRSERFLSPQITEQVIQHALGNEEELEQSDLNDTEEQQILRLLATGENNAQIAARLYVSEATVKRKIKKIFRKLNVTTRAQASAEAVRRGLIK